ncbi:MAG: carboxypeptidase-like regulatory domain-containing protein, partial [Oscillospiraceae bacterium]|nr:carboxypeptidase-like regulatory domain-containing protein [Oscillospiraceae bacterium]
LTALTMDTELTEYAPEIAGYDVDESAKTITVKAENNVIGFVYTPRNDTKYTVRHILQDLSGEYTIIPKTDEMTGTTDEMTKAVPESYEGFSNQAVTNEPIKGDGTTVVDIRYDRLSYTVAFYDYKGEPIEAVKTLYFGAEITAPAVVPDYLTEESGFTFRHVFTSWNITVPTTIPVGGVAAFAKYTMPCAYAGFDDAVKALHDLVDGEELNDAAEKKLDELLKLIDGINGGKSTRDASEQKTVDDAEKKIRDFILEISEDGNIDPDILVHYDVSFFVKKNFGETEQLGKTQSVASGRAAEVPTDIEDYYDAANHYSFSGKWSLTSSDGSLESVRSNINAYAVYDAQAHTLIDTVIVRPELMSGKWSSGKVRSACKCGYFFDTDYERADYTKYDKAVSDLRSLLEKDIRSDIRLEIESVLAANEIENNLIGTNPSPRNAALIGEQWIVDEAAKSLALTLEKYLDDDGNIKNDIFNKYTVSFVNYDGFILEQIENVVSGNTVRYTGKTPERPFDESFHYVFAGWDKDASSTQITADTVFTAQFESVSHSKTKLVCEPTCTEEGYTVYKCLDCAYLSEKSDFVPAKGHSFNRDPATATLVEAGIAGLDETFTYDRYKCDDCDAMAIVLHIVTVDPESDNSPVVGADVTIINGSGQKVDGGKTDENGRFDSKYLPAEDSYRIRIEDPETGRVAKGDIAVDGDAYIIDGSFSGRLGDCGECICHTNTKFGIIIRFICTILSGVFGTEIKCCKDMKWCFKI